jgi:hypothetical protein
MNPFGGRWTLTDSQNTTVSRLSEDRRDMENHAPTHGTVGDATMGEREHARHVTRRDRLASSELSRASPASGRSRDGRVERWRERPQYRVKTFPPRLTVPSEGRVIHMRLLDPVSPLFRRSRNPDIDIHGGTPRDDRDRRGEREHGRPTDAPFWRGNNLTCASGGLPSHHVPDIRIER